MGLSKSFSGMKEEMRTLGNDTKWVLDMVKGLRKGDLYPFKTEEDLLSDVESVLEGMLERINN
ncbi:hypothetical protein P7D15_01175 [Bacillus cereus]|uniref:Uncharacterized protein n=1 Tax=Bacillus thuringiensis TaxID=1428 RepID=A0A9X6VE60_BACTU|nr:MULTISPECIES: hypothetical protein [Bacillus cereus group]HDR7922251.1 hypothetical protein [Bacillus paranthracis]MDF9599026.1 hypothetical protein [Bacillus cereus]MDG1589359.1 hypothetical protein [Bacillus cereus]MEC3272672.1 hypothetical protein [Bacillus thuringiensis]PFB09156.1 hypothetical protein CN398_06015 [Bacillus thuringiensis]